MEEKYSLDYRRATVEDAEDIYTILKLAGENMSEKYGLHHWIPAYALDKIVEDIRNKFVFIGKKDNKAIVTFSLGTEPYGFWLTQPPVRAVYSGKTAVLPEFDGYGYGIETLKYTDVYAAREGYERIRCEVYDKNTRHIIYMKMAGYVESGRFNTRRFEVVCLEKVLGTDLYNQLR